MPSSECKPNLGVELDCPIMIMSLLWLVHFVDSKIVISLDKIIVPPYQSRVDSLLIPKNLYKSLVNIIAPT